jgi:hypothetical protein
VYFTWNFPPAAATSEPGTGFSSIALTVMLMTWICCAGYFDFTSVLPTGPKTLAPSQQVGLVTTVPSK